MVPHTCNPATWETKAGRLLLVQVQPGLVYEFKTGLRYIVEPCLKAKQRHSKDVLLCVCETGS